MADATAATLRSLSTLQLALVIAMMHLTHTYEGQGFNFQMLHCEYLKFTRRHSSLHGYKRPVVAKAFEQLVSLELVTPCAGEGGGGGSRGGMGGVGNDYQLMRLQAPPLLLKQIIASLPCIPTDLLQWAGSALSL